MTAETAPTILVVDDNEGNRLLAEDTLESEGYRVVLAKNGAEALAAFDREAPDCVLLDAAMPEMDGFAVCTKIRQAKRRADTPVVFLTAHRDVETFDRALAAGADDFLTKPVRPTELLVRVRSALKLRRMSAELDTSYLELRKQRDDLLRLHLQKERLMAFVVHDLKNPVNAMDLHAQALLGEDLPAEALSSLRVIRSEARHLTRMILNLLDVSKRDEGKLVAKRTPASLVSLVDAVFAELDLAAQQRSVHLVAEMNVDRADVDADLFRRLIANLVDNALRHSPRESTVRVRSSQGPGGLLLEVADEGAGIPAEKRASIFEAFVQMDASTDRESLASRGLGLTFCELVARAHGGRIGVSDAGPGALFQVILPDAG